MSDVDRYLLRPAARLPERYRHRIEAAPLQLPGRPRRVRTEVYAGPEQDGERVFILDAPTLEQLLRVARSSLAQRVHVGRAGLQIDVWSRDDGTSFETWRILGVDPRPERLPL